MSEHTPDTHMGEFAYEPTNAEIREAWQWARKWGTCPVAVTRKDELEPCDKPAVALHIYAGGEHEPGVFPVCKRHTAYRMVTLDRLAKALFTRDAAEQEATP